MNVMNVKFRVGKYLVPVQLIPDTDKRYIVKFAFSKPLIAEIKQMEGARWNPDNKYWTIANSFRNHFQMKFLMGENPYAKYDAPLLEATMTRPEAREHQQEMFRHAITRGCSILACEMGTGKSLVGIEVAEWLERKKGIIKAWYIGPKAGVKAVSRELIKWDCKIDFRMMTYDALTRVIREWRAGMPAPDIVLFDESTKIKTHSAQRTQAALHLANSVREEHGDDGIICLMTGSPAPKSPVDWWAQSEVACPGFLAEGHPNKLKNNLSLTEQRESITGAAYPHLLTWLDDEAKCGKCGQFKDADVHGITSDHMWVPSVNEVARLYKRLQGLVLIKFKKDCTDLPEIQYRQIQVKPTPEIMRAAAMLKLRVPRAVTLLSRLRELSDGFMYRTVETDDEVTCPVCQGTGTTSQAPEVDTMSPLDLSNVEFEFVECTKCDGTGLILREERQAEEVGSPKDEILKDLLDEHEEVGRFIVWGGFTGSIDRITKMVLHEGWVVLQVDGRGYKTFSPNGEQVSSDTLLAALDLSNPDREELLKIYPRVCFVGNPKAGGMALTLTSSPTELFYSNSFDGEARIQAEARFHRLGMDLNRGATIIDLIMLPSDLLVLNNLKLKKKLQSLTLGELKDAWADAEIEMERIR